MWEYMTDAEKKALKWQIFWACVGTIAGIAALGWAFNRALNLSGYPF